MRFSVFVAIAAAAFTSQAEAILIQPNEYSYAQLETDAEPVHAKFKVPEGVPTF